MLSSFKKGKLKKLLILTALVGVVGMLYVSKNTASIANVKKVDRYNIRATNIIQEEIRDHIHNNIPSSMQETLAPVVQQGETPATQLDAALETVRDGASKTQQGKTPAPQQGKPPAPQQGKSPAPQQGKPSAPQQGKPAPPQQGKPPAPQQGKPRAAQQGKPPATQQNIAPEVQSNTTVYRKKYLIYLCDKKMYCFGLGDRQRAIAGVYFLAELTNRTFGLVMTAPANFTEFYQPNLVNWDIPPEDLKGKSTREVRALGRRVNLNLNKIVFNQVYPEDVVYVRTNQVFQHAVRGNTYYEKKYPEWAKVALWRIFPLGWLRLMKPTDTLRQALNEMLIKIAQIMHDDYLVWQMLKSSGCCNATTTSSPASVNNICETAACTTRMNQKCCGLKATGDLPFECNSWTCPSINKSINAITPCTNSSCIGQTSTSLISSQRCTDYLQETVNNVTEFSRLKPFSDHFCNVQYPRWKPQITVEGIRKLKGHATIDLNLVCVHVRIGRSSTLPFEGHVRNKESSVKAVWEFLKPYIAKGFHVYIATDSQQVRKEGKRIFGYRVHVSDEDIVQIATLRKGQDARSGLELSLMEQLLLSTSCRVLVVSKSGYSMKAATIRHELGLGGNTFMFINGVVIGKSVKWM